MYIIRNHTKIAKNTQKHKTMATNKAIDGGSISRVRPGREKFSFLRGYNAVPNKDSSAVRTEIMSALKLNSRVAWYKRLYGDVEPKISEYKAIENIFAKYGVKKCWGV